MKNKTESPTSALRVSLVVLVSCTAALAQQPRIDGVVPPQGPIGGGMTVSIKGASLAPASVTIDSAPVLPLSQSTTEIQLRMPAHDNGYAVIRVSGGGGNAYGEFLYVPPRLEELAPGSITTVAGIGLFTRTYGPARNASVSPEGIVVDAHDTIFIAEPGANRVVKVNADGTIELVAGTGTTNADGMDPRDGAPAVNAQISFPHSVAVDPAGNVYIPDNHYRIRKVSPTTGFISTIAGNGQCCASGDGGPAENAQVGLPSFLAADDKDLFFIDWDAMRIRRINLSSGQISTFAGTGSAGFSGDGGPATGAQIDVGFNADFGALALDSAGNVYLGDYGNARIRRIDRKTEIITTVVAGATVRALVVGTSGKIYYSDGNSIVETTADGLFSRRWSPGGTSLADGATTSESYLGFIGGLAFDSAGHLLIADSTGRIRRLDLDTSKLYTVAGNAPQILGDGGPAIASSIGPNGIAFNVAGELLIADGPHIRRIDHGGIITTIAGTGLAHSPEQNKPATDVTLFAQQIEATKDGGIDIADGTNVNRIDANGIYRFVVANGRGSCGYTGDGGPALTADVCQVFGTARDSHGNLFVADTNNNRIRRVDAATGIMTTFAGNGGPIGSQEHFGSGTFCGDGGPAFDSCLNSPMSLAFDREDNLFIADFSNFRIRRIDARTGVITTFADSFGSTAITHDKTAYLYAHLGDRIVRYAANGAETIIAGGAQANGFSGDGGPALAARVDRGAGFSVFAIDGDGDLLFSDPGNRRVRAIRYGAVLPPPSVTFSVHASGSVIRATVDDAIGRPAPSVRVDFTVPATGASCTLSSSFAITSTDGEAIVSCIPNCVAGVYDVTAKPVTATSTAKVSLTNSGYCRHRAVTH